MCKLYITICIYIFFYFQPDTQAYNIYQLNSNARNDLLPKLKQLLNAQQIEEPRFEKIYINKERSKYGKFKPIGKSLIVKRIIPHGYKGDEYEYDAKLNTVYKPLVRYHVKKPANEHERTIVKEIEDDYNSKNGIDDGVIVLLKKGRNNNQDLLSKIDNFLKKTARPHKKKKGWNKKRFRQVMSRLDEDEEEALLRVLDKSGEVHDPLAPGKLPIHLESSSEEEEEERPKHTLPNYPFYNYWTYQKNILQDLCPGNTVQMGNICMSVTGHRRSGTIKDAIKSGTNIVF
ncbi:hypothetical protein B5X24_HaOG204175 [Helicoverpa armigera]|uniref:Uncharacterized protein n=1 Tax=Helicoverpa armigera TaxID=29058 RepID=A0A2W1BQX7_HELAM|nr:hypothetical protein B5X24_HaOG204175 [Helicoverpa armigera]